MCLHREPEEAPVGLPVSACDRVGSCGQSDVEGTSGRPHMRPRYRPGMESAGKFGRLCRIWGVWLGGTFSSGRPVVDALRWRFSGYRTVMCDGLY